MLPPMTTDSYRHHSEARVEALRRSMTRPPLFAPRRAFGAWMVSTGLRLAPELRAHPPQRATSDASEAPARAGASSCLSGAA